MTSHAGSSSVPDWWRALTLVERLTLVKRAPLDGACEPDDREAARRLDRWRSLPPFDDASVFAMHLASIGASEEQFLAALGTQPPVMGDTVTDPSGWLAELKRACDRATTAGDDLMVPSTPSSFLSVIEPLVGLAQARLRASIANLVELQRPTAFESDTVHTLFHDELRQRLLGMLTRTLVLELHIARIEGRLDGATPEERFGDYVGQLHSCDALRGLLHDYPVLARQLTVGLDQWVTATTELLERVTADYEAIREAFFPNHDPGPLRAASAGLGDRHGNGRSVTILTFASGARVVYKPRSLAVDRHWNALLDWVGDHGFSPQFRTLRLLERDRYGWVEFIEPRPCVSGEEVRRFYERHGGYLALLYMLDAADFHSENVIAEGEHPVLLDLEGLLSAAVRPPVSTRARDVAWDSLEASVIRTGLLPTPWGEPSGGIADFSGLGGKDGQLSPYAVPQWAHAHSDAMWLVRKPVAVSGAQNRPSLNGAPVELLSQADVVARGFCRLYDVILENRDALLAAGGPVAAFADDEVRVILRSTRTYGVLLEEGFHPDVLRDALERDWLFSRLWMKIKDQPALAQVINAEQRALWRGDVPRFTTSPGSRDLWTCSGDCIPGFLSDTPMASVQRRLKRLGPDDLEKQVWLIRASIVTDSVGLGIGRPKRALPQLVGANGDDDASLIEAASGIGDRVDALAVRGDDDVAWVGLSLIREDRWSVAPLGSDLYDGVTGIVLFLAYLGHVSGRDRYVALARSALSSVRHQLPDGPVARTIGAFDGLGGIIYLLSHLAALWQRADLAAQANTLAIRLDRLVDQDTRYDVIGGAAGAIAGLASLHAIDPTGPALRVARRCGDWLADHATPMPTGVGWINADMSERAMVGYSHGAAGIAWALSMLARLTGDGRYRDCARAAVDYERSLFDPVARNWPDLRERKLTDRQGGGGAPPSAEPPPAWCHGAAGIALARLHMLACLDAATTRAEIESAIATTIADGFGDNHSLCHGDLGNLDVLMQAEEQLGEPWLVDARRRATALAVGSIRRGEWICGIPLNVESPGLMTGLAGIGYGLLRLAAPDYVPSVLALSPPPLIRRQHA